MGGVFSSQKWTLCESAFNSNWFFFHFVATLFFYSGMWTLTVPFNTSDFIEIGFSTWGPCCKMPTSSSSSAHARLAWTYFIVTLRLLKSLHCYQRRKKQFQTMYSLMVYKEMIIILFISLSILFINTYWIIFTWLV